MQAFTTPIAGSSWRATHFNRSIYRMPFACPAVFIRSTSCVPNLAIGVPMDNAASQRFSRIATWKFYHPQMNVILPAMRFSLGILFAAMAYVALVVGTIVAKDSTLVSLTWTATAIAFCYAAVTLCFARGKRQAVALGFVLLSSSYFAVLCFYPLRTPAAQLFSTFGYGVSNRGTLYALDTPPKVQIPSLNFLEPDRSYAGSRAVLGAANAAGTMLASLVGCGIGALAYRHSHEPDHDS